MVKQLEAIFDRLARAEEHLETIKSELLSYYHSDPYSMSAKYEPDDDGATVTPTDGWVEPIPVRLNTLLGEFVHDLRSALDHLARQLVIQNGGKPAPNAEISFPILAKRPIAKKQGKNPLPNLGAGGASPEAREVIDDAQPYKLGESYRTHPLWVLHKLWNIDKHRDVLARGVWPESHFRGADIPAFSYKTRLESVSEDMAQYRLMPHDPTVDVDAYATVQVALYESELGIERALLWTLKQILQAVLGVVNTAEDRCF
jgi:hypothetical protein